ncbi:hypothetical protein C0989_002067 [Termitomyces sp. Mn162]|nr:hypothetical protein C0989_002067 [Termitomyces sp. Mn162]
MHNKTTVGGPVESKEKGKNQEVVEDSNEGEGQEAQREGTSRDEGKRELVEWHDVAMMVARSLKWRSRKKGQSLVLAIPGRSSASKTPCPWQAASMSLSLLPLLTLANTLLVTWQVDHFPHFQAMLEDLEWLGNGFIAQVLALNL